VAVTQRISPENPLSAAPLPQNVNSVARFPADRLGDAELVEAIARADAQAMGVVWDRYSPLIRGILRGSFGPDVIVEDLLQDVFVVLMRCARDMRDPNALRSFLISVAVRSATVEFRRRKVRRLVSSVPNDELPEAAVSPSDFAGTEVLRALYRILARMSARRKISFVLRHVQGLEISEVADALRVSESTAKREIGHACEIIRNRAKSEPALWQYLQGLDGQRHE
jgi:RNA polymerase sigma-70 factor (ECF subfamily)